MSRHADRQAHDLLDRTLSGRYRVVRLLGEGAIGLVYEVAHLQLERPFAVKVLKQEHCTSESALTRFRREAKVGGLLRSQHTVEVIDYDDDGGVPYFVMEHLQGETLQAILAREGVLPVRRAATLLVQACRGLHCAHMKGILHRDLKPSNLFVVPAKGGELCKVLDFGVAKAGELASAEPMVPSTSSGAIIGTLNYMPPEQLRGQRDLDERVDVYALATILYECLAGKPAFEAPTPPLVMYKILEEAPRSLGALRPELPKGLVELVERGMARDRERRIGSVEALQQELLPFAEGIFSLSVGELATDIDFDGSASRVRRAAKSRARARLVPLLAVAALSGGLAGALGYRVASVAPAPAAESVATLAPGTPDPQQEFSSILPVRSGDGRTPTAHSAQPSAPFDGPRASAESLAKLAPLRSGRGSEARANTTPTAAQAATATVPRTTEAPDFDRRNPYRAGSEP
jgi:serine/threonine protein kinase